MKKIRRWLWKLWLAVAPISWIEKRYFAAGREFGEAVSYAIYGKPGNWKEARCAWRYWTVVYKARGYLPIPFYQFLRWGGYDVPVLPELIGVKS
jgi:hypothetical protein